MQNRSMLNPDFINELREQFTGDIRLDLGSRVLYSTDASIYQIEPLGVVLPRTQEDLHSAVELAARYRIPLLPRGSGSSLAGQAIGEALILDCSRWLDRIIAIDPGSKTATVEPGVILSDLNRAAAKHGLMFGPDPASAERATLGGVIGNNATGAHSILYGMTADHLLSADVILSDGSLATFDDTISDSQLLTSGSRLSNITSAIFHIRQKYADVIQQDYPKSWRNSAGYRLNYLLPWSASQPPQWIGDAYPANLKPGMLNLAPLLAGSEGTLAVIRRATIRLVDRPKHTILGILSYDNVAEACDAVPELLSRNPSAIELIPELILRLARTIPAYSSQMGWVVNDPAAVLVVEFGGEQPGVLKEAAMELRDDVVIVESAADQAQVWSVRKAGLGILDSRPQAARPIAFIEDCAIPVERLGEFVREIQSIMSAHKTEGGIYAHASAGCLHIRPILDLRSSEGVHALRSIAEQTLAVTMGLGGSLSSEHGDGIVRGEWLEQTYGGEITEAMRMLKRAADPFDLLNPKKMFDAPPMDTHLRYGENYQTHPWVPSLDFTHENGLAGAIEQCNGQGVCRKNTDVMCPSFQATREEKYSTRGRSNLLRALMTDPVLKSRIAKGVIRASGLEKSVHDALDFCLACKGCTAECPSGVDMPKLKFEFQYQYYKSHRRPLRDYVFGYFHLAARWFSRFAPLVNWVTSNHFMKSIVARSLGIASERPFPKFTRQRARPSRNQNRQRVIFFSDPYAHYIEPQVEQSAFDILDQLGFDVCVLPVVGAGAALLSKGFLDAARRHALSVLDALDKIDPDASLPLVGIEPPEIYSFKHDYLDLLPDRSAVVLRRAERSWLLEEFLIRTDAFRSLSLHKKNINLPRVKFHPHCHQRAEGPSADAWPSGVDATAEALRVCGYEVDILRDGCCGMAGTFGYETEHYDLSVKIGELKLLPDLRSLSPEGGWIVASTGAACRMQIAQGAGWKARHPIELLSERLWMIKRES
ncbi:MAG TPA: FAD-linked oxidase C-terminal domain-containing protein [Anaerolineales bacterium]|nr:FAD-linked oxidase C-terminal domain-containing protein [Anaerolineales bacterium]